MPRSHTPRHLRNAALMAMALGAAAPLAAASAAPHVTIAQGALIGKEAQGVDAFLGIPFAAPPTGANRWRAPQPAQGWKAPRDAAHFGASCWQPVDKRGFGPWSHEYVVQDEVSEDCLFLNVWRPAQRAEAKLPVLVWIHGGGFSSGSGSVPIYDGAKLAARGAIVVTINYRIGVLGFLAHPDLTREAKGAPPANFGLQDQIAALRWLRDNVAAFGGDPARITIAGQSAGSMSVHDLVASPMAHGLFRGAIAQSGLPTGPMTGKPLAAAEADGVEFAHARGADSLAALRALTPAQLNAGQGPGLRFAPVVDGVLLPASVPDLMARGAFNDVPMIVGQTVDDGVSLAPPQPVSETAYRTYLTQTYGAMADRFAALYPATDNAARQAAMDSAHLDRGLASLWQWGQDRLTKGKAPIWAYLFSHVEPGPESARWKVFHSSEIPYVFDTMHTSPERGFTAKDREVSLEISEYWLNFVKYGTPNAPGAAAKAAPQWPQMTLPNPTMLNIGDATKAVPLLPAAKLEAYRAYLAQGGVVSMF